MRYEEVRELLLRHWRYTSGPNEAKASEIYHDDAVLEFPQSGERFRGKANIQGWRQQYPAQLDFEPREIRRSGGPLDRGGPTAVRQRQPGPLRQDP